MGQIVPCEYIPEEDNLNAQTEQITATQTTRAITEIKEQVQLDRWQKQIEERQATGLSIDAFCGQQGISKSTYYYRPPLKTSQKRSVDREKGQKMQK